MYFSRRTVPNIPALFLQYLLQLSVRAVRFLPVLHEFRDELRLAFILFALMSDQA